MNRKTFIQNAAICAAVPTVTVPSPERCQEIIDKWLFDEHSEHFPEHYNKMMNNPNSCHSPTSDCIHTLEAHWSGLIRCSICKKELSKEEAENTFKTHNNSFPAPLFLTKYLDL